MTDNVVLNLGSAGDTVAADDIAGVKHQRVKLSLGADGTAADAPVGGGVEAGTLRVTIASDSTGVLSVDDNGGSLTVDGTVAVSGTVAVTDNSGSLTVDNGGTFAVQATLAAGATTIAKAEDAAHSSGDVGAFALGVRQDTATQLAGTDGDYSPLITDANGRLHTIAALAASQTLATVTTVGAVTAITNALPAGTNAIGKLSANSGVDIGDVDVTTVGTITPGTAATSLGKAEDAAHTSGDVGVLMLGVRQDADTSPVSATGDYQAPIFDANGYLKVNIKAGAGSGGTAMTDAAAFTRATTSVTPIAGVVETSAPTLTNGNAGALSLTTAGAVRVNVASGGIAAAVEDAAAAGGEDGVMMLAVRRDSASSGVSADGDFAALSVTSDGSLRVSGSSGTTQYAEDAVAASGDSGVMMLAVRRDSASSGVSADGDYAALSVTSDGSLRVAGSAGTTQYTEDVASAGAESLCLMGAVRRDSAASSSGTDGDYSTINTDATGNLRVTTNTQYAEDAASAGGELMTLAGAIRSDTPNTTAGTNGDYTPLLTDANGRLHVISALAAAQTLATVTTVSTVTNVATIGTSITPGTAAANLGKAEDAAHTSGDVGVMSLSVRQDTAAALAGTDADYQPLITDASGRLHVNVGNTVTVGSHAVTNAGTFAVQENGTQVQADDAVFTPATSKVTMAGFTADESSTDSVDEGDGGAARMTLDRKQIVAAYAHAAAGGATPYQNLDCDETEDDIKTSAGKLFWVHAINLTAVKQYLKFYNATAANTTVGSTTPVLTFPLPTMGDTNGAGFTINFGAIGVQFDTAICVAATTGFAVADTGAPATNAVILNCGYA